MSNLNSSNVTLIHPICTSLASCLAFGKVSCDRASQECPPCIYTDAKGRSLCYARITGTVLCPFVNTTADCSTSNDTSSSLVLVNKTSNSFPKNKTASTYFVNTTASPDMDAAATASHGSMSSLNVGLVVTVVVLAAAIVVMLVMWIKRSRNVSRRGIFSEPKRPHYHNNREIVHIGSNVFHSQNQNQRPHPGNNTNDYLTSINRLHTPVLGEPMTLGGGYSQDSSPVWRMSTSSNILR
ncbi:hypothetical protein DYB37_011890 [Aphanomyces astaci]|uniref:Uncharacterized protein n=2 Tax=Aphanomyces astaci TaxID=112090 RepID=A0A397FTW1_APHAT|nr:hypothetical protein DYB25_007984 [Aphanomyces astaci]RHY93968.1 hypothetical protein DYB35_003939 [Aphanomyces astaci]RHZ29148.1 hypothetical protein DYB37_011890 [Aphanomyces astaci]RHZ39948.1 hypothetical protein DYB31_009174 [Aphanomyces astaci]RLO09852.1 hypothetical protein DYB28_008779 [Aphanomyces astaci]